METESPFLFVPLAQFPSNLVEAPITFAVRTSGDPASLLPYLESELRNLDPKIPVAGLGTLSDELNRVLMPQRTGAFLLTFFAVLSLLLAAVGIYGVASYTVTQEIRHIGIRMALGATRAKILAHVTGGMLVPLAAGIAAGLSGGLALSRLVERFLFGVGPRDPLTFAGLSLALAGVALVATLLPAHRAAGIDPARALRYE